MNQPPQIVVVQQKGATEGCFSCLWMIVSAVVVMVVLGAVVLCVLARR